MELILTIENETSLPNGSPLSVRVADGGSLDIGRSSQLDWSLPDDTRFISGKHCEVRYRDHGYWLYDVSTNGTFVNDETQRMEPKQPHRLRDGDRIIIGRYVIVVGIEGEHVKPPADEREFIEPQPHQITEVAKRAADSVFSLDIERQSRTPPPVVEVTPPEDEVRVRRPAVFRPGKRTPSPIVPPFEEDDPVPDWANLTSGNSPALQDPADLPQVSESHVQEARAPEKPSVAEPPVMPGPATGGAQRSMPRVSSFKIEPVDLDASAAAAKNADEMVPPVSVQSLDPPAPDRFAQPPGSQDRAAAAGDDAAGATEFIRRFAKGAGIPEQVFARRDALEVAEELGVLMHLVADNLKQLLSARHEAKRFTRASNQTMIQALDNNPLKFAPNVEDALKIMLGPRTRSYLDARRTLETAFQDLKTHQINTFSAMQGAVKMLVKDLDPQEIETTAGSDDGLSGWLGNRKNRLWDIFLARWQAKTMHHSDGIVGAFMLYFAECYDREDD